MMTTADRAATPRGWAAAWRSPWTLAIGSALGAAILWHASRFWPDLVLAGPSLSTLTGGDPPTPTAAPIPPLIEALKLVVAALIGLVITVVQRRTRPDRPASASMEQAQVLLAVSGALMMIVIGNSLARAFGIAGAASIVRFRTPVEDPRDVTVLFLLMGLGMAAGLGAIAVAALATAFLSCCLILLSRLGETTDRFMKVALIADGSAFPAEHVETVFASRQIRLEPVEVTRGDTAVRRYRARVAADESLEDLSTQLLNGGATGIKSVSWEVARRNG